MHLEDIDTLSKNDKDFSNKVITVTKVVSKLTELNFLVVWFLFRELSNNRFSQFYFCKTLMLGDN